MKESKTIHFFHQLGAMPRFFIALTPAAIVFFLTNSKSTTIQSISVWISFALATLFLEGITMFTAHPREITHIVKKQDFSRILIFLIILVASFVSLFAIVALLRRLPGAGEKGYYYHIALFVGSVVSSWFLIHTVFTFRYAHLFYTGDDKEYGVDKKHRGGLIFPNDKTPDYLDFAYFSFVIGMTFQVSDVQISSSSIRRLALLHGLLSFLFNTVILAISINIIAGLIQKTPS
jgi:uncharacterized membrane protein